LLHEEPDPRFGPEQLTPVEITLPRYALIFAQMPGGRVVTERQYTHGVGGTIVVLPAGLIASGEEPLTAAKRELLEATGYATDKWRPLGNFVVNGNHGCGRVYFFAARNARQIAETDAGDPEDIEVALLSIDELSRLVRGGEVTLLSTVVALALATHPRFGE